jgi:signal transduction histidine kinase
VVSKEELTARVWPDTAAEESSLRVHIAGLRKALGDTKDGARHVTNVPGRGYCFLPPVHERAPRRGPARLPVHWPSEATMFRLDWRGSSAGKTRSASSRSSCLRRASPASSGPAAWARPPSRSPSRTRYSPISKARFTSSIWGCSPTLARSPTASPPRSAWPRLPTTPRRASSPSSATAAPLLVLDSCDHVLETVAPLAERIFHEAVRVHILTTSREPLRVEGEHVHRMTPLASPPSGESTTAARAMTFPAVQLFVERATAGGARLTLTDVNAPVVAEICWRLDGIPLAIEFAAARVDAYGIRGTAAILEHRFKLLWQGRRTAPSRHQTLAAMLDWSYDLLSELERTVLRRLSIFIGIFSLDAVAAVDYERETTTPTLDHVLRRIHPEDIALIRELLDRVGHHSADFETEFRLLMPDRSVKHIHIVGQPVGDADASEFVGAVMDVSAAREMAQALAFRDQVMGILGHDLRNPLSAVLGIVGLAQLDEQLSDAVRKHMAQIKRAAGRMLEMIETLLDFTRTRLPGSCRSRRPRRI